MRQTDALANYSRYTVFTFSQNVSEMFNKIKEIIASDKKL